jgi:hypothetical protein
MTEGILPAVMLALGWLIGHWLAVRREKHRVVIEKRADYVSEFIAQAYYNLRYLLQPDGLGSDAPAISDFTIMGRRAAFFTSDAAARAIDEVTTEYARARTKMAEPSLSQPCGEDYFKTFKDKVDCLNQRLRAEVGIERQPRLRAILAWRFPKSKNRRRLNRP